MPDGPKARFDALLSAVARGFRTTMARHENGVRCQGQLLSSIAVGDKVIFEIEWNGNYGGVIGIKKKSS